MKLPPALMISTILLALFSLPRAHALTRRAKMKAPRVPLAQVYFLQTPGPKSKQLACYLVKQKPKVGIFKSSNSKGVSLAELVSTKATKSILKAARTECSAKFSAPDCSDGQDNDEDGLRDYPADSGCESETDTTETLPEEATPFEVFRKPFDGNFSAGGLFDHRYALEFIHTDGVVISSWNDETTIGVDGHQGYDFSLPENTPVFSAGDGVVDFAGQETPFFCPLLNQTVSGNSVYVRHSVEGQDFLAVYAHFNSLSVTTGQTVSKGTQLGLSGNTGCSTGPHLHFDIQRVTGTNDGDPASIDPFGWNGSSPDPWETHAQGTQSFSLWEPGYSPEVYRYFSLAPNPNDGNNASVAITKMQWSGILDSANPNNEYLELTLDTRFSGGNSANLSGYKLRNVAGDVYVFPTGTTIRAGTPLRLYSGAGVNTDSTLYWNLDKEAWSNKGDCARLTTSTNSPMYFLFYGLDSCPAASSNAQAGGAGIREEKDMHQPIKENYKQLQRG